MTFISNNIESEGYITGNTVTANSISATTISGITFHGDGSNLTNVNSIFTGGTVTGNTIFTGDVNVSGTTILKNFTYVNGTIADGKVLTSDGNGNATWEYPEALNIQTYMFSSANSDIGGYEQAVILTSYSTASTATITTNISSTPTLMVSFATNANYPNITVIPSGIVHVHYETEKAAGSNNYYTYFELYKRTTGGTETLLTTSENSTETSSNTIQQISVAAFLTNNIFLNASDRIVVKVYGVMLSSTANVNFYYDDNTNSRLELPVTISTDSYIPYSGANQNVDLGLNRLTANELVSTNGITGSTLNISSIPSNDNALTQVLVRGTDGTIKYRTASSLAGSGGTGASVTAFTYNNLNTLTISDSENDTFSATINQMSGLTVGGILSATTISATTYYGNGGNLTGITGSFGISVDGSGSVLTSGVKGYVILPYNATITGWDIIGNTSGTCVFDVWRGSNYQIPTVINTITGNEKPNLNSQQINSDNSLSSWTTDVFINDVISFNIISATTISRVNLIIKVIKK